MRLFQALSFWRMKLLRPRFLDSSDALKNRLAEVLAKILLRKKIKKKLP